MKIEVIISEKSKHATDVRTIVDVDDKLYSQSTGVMITTDNFKNSMNIEILETVKRHIERIQRDMGELN